MSVDACEVITHMDTILLADESKWTKHTRWRWNDDFKSGQMCLLGALSTACAGGTHEIPEPHTEAGHVYRRVCDAICEAAGVMCSNGNVIEFNDSPRTTFADVKTALRKARQSICS
jgi:hypothetical protein